MLVPAVRNDDESSSKLKYRVNREKEKLGQARVFDYCV